MYSIGVDIGGSKIAAGRLEDDGRLSDDGETALPTRDYDGLVEVVAAEVGRLRVDGPSPTLGIAMAAWLTPDRERVLTSANLGWADRSLRRDVEAATGLPTAVHNDGDAAAWGEHVLAGRPTTGALVLLTLGTDVGGGVVIDGRLRTGPTGVAGELGHVRVTEGGPVCVCGARGCLSVYASGTAMLGRARAVVHESRPGAERLTELCAGDADRLDGLAFNTAATHGDPATLTVIEETASAIAHASSQISRVIDHDRLVLGGGASALGARLVDAVVRAIDRAEPVGPLHPRPVVSLARGGNRSGVVGAADLAARRTERTTKASAGEGEMSSWTTSG
jgi:glucokinase